MMSGMAVWISQRIPRLVRSPHAGKSASGALPSFGDRYPSYDERVTAIRQIQDRLETLPGVESAAFATSLPVYGYNAQRQILMEGQTAGDAASLPTARLTLRGPCRTCAPQRELKLRAKWSRPYAAPASLCASRGAR